MDFQLLVGKYIMSNGLVFVLAREKGLPGSVHRWLGLVGNAAYFLGDAALNKLRSLPRFAIPLAC